MSRMSPNYRPVVAAAVLLSALTLLLPATARAEASTFSLQFSSRTPGTPTGARIYIVYRKPSDPNGKPSPIKHLAINAPQGTRIDLALPSCTAGDQQIMIEGPSACPPDSQVGQGTLTADTGFGPPLDPYPTDVKIFNTGQGWVEVVRDHSTGITLADDRLQVRGDVITGNPPSIPGGPPDGQTAVRTIDFSYRESAHYFTTPARCATGQWISTASFTFADGTTQRLTSTTPCAISKSTRQARQHRMHRSKHHRA